MVIGILALQGGYALHEQKLGELGIETQRIIYPCDLKNVNGLIIPGGESSTILKLCTEIFFNELKEFSQSHPVWGICAGAIFIAGVVEKPSQKSLGLLDISIERNAYGNQNDSFIEAIHFECINGNTRDCIFIRAPKITSVGNSVKTLATCNDEIIMVEDGIHLATTFHPELSDQLDFHEYFLEKVKSAL